MLIWMQITSPQKKQFCEANDLTTSPHQIIAHLKFAPVLLVMNCKHTLVPCLVRCKLAVNFPYD